MGKSRKASTRKPKKVARAKARSQPRQQEDSGFGSFGETSGGGLYG